VKPSNKLLAVEIDFWRQLVRISRKDKIQITEDRLLLPITDQLFVIDQESSAAARFTFYT
jgi:acetone carboxylase gamma subunit